MRLMQGYWRLVMAAAAAVCVALPATTWRSPAHAGEPAVKAFQAAAYGGDFSGGIAKLTAIAQSDTDDVEAVFGLGALQFFGALVDLQEGLYKHRTKMTTQRSGGRWARSLMSFGMGMGDLLLAPPNPNAKPMTYGTLRRLLTDFNVKLTAAERTLARVGDRDVRLPLKPFDIAVDLDHNGKIEQHERILAKLLGGRGRRMREDVFGAELAFDTADASWLRGYTHVLLASVNFMLAFDFENSYDVAAHNIYGDAATTFGLELARQAGLGRPREIIQAELDVVEAKLKEINREKSTGRDIRDLRNHIKTIPDTPANAEQRRLLQDALKNMIANKQRHRKARAKIYQEQWRLSTERDGAGDAWIYDIVAFVHTLSWDIVEPHRLKAARDHLLRVMALNRNTWRLVRAETDDDREWLPNAKQTPPFKAKPLKDDVIDSWLATTALAEQVLKGEKLLPHPRFKKGVNLHKLMESAKRLDFVLLATGHDLVPYLEVGETVDQKTWDAITQPMGGHVGQYALWFN